MPSWGIERDLRHASQLVLALSYCGRISDAVECVRRMHAAGQTLFPETYFGVISGIMTRLRATAYFDRSNVKPLSEQDSVAAAKDLLPRMLSDSKAVERYVMLRMLNVDCGLV